MLLNIGFSNQKENGNNNIVNTFNFSKKRLDHFALGLQFNGTIQLMNIHFNVLKYKHNNIYFYSISQYFLILYLYRIYFI